MSLRDDYKSWLRNHGVHSSSYFGSPVKDLLEHLQVHQNDVQTRAEIDQVDRSRLNKDQKTWLKRFAEFVDERIRRNGGEEILAQPEEQGEQQPDQQIEQEESMSMQKIIFGAPGTGKSFKINDAEKGYGLERVGIEFKFRTTFHPDYDFAQFVGSYKPLKGSETDPATTRIYYDFVPQIFAKAYVKAWTEYLKANDLDDPDADPESAEEMSEETQKVYLIIEEINRGQCAQIFGDIFQLLDRKNGRSEYSIDIDSNFAAYIEKQLSNVRLADGETANYWESYKQKIRKWDAIELDDSEGNDEFCKAALPPNMVIYATMNTSDQSLFPMDSAFKRRFDWEYVPIKYKKDDSCGETWNADTFKIQIGTSRYSWLKFLKIVNANVYMVTRTEDKQMGEFFIKPQNGNIIGFKAFRSKVLFYLWDSVYKNEEGNSDAEKVFFFNNPVNNEPVTFQSLFEEDEEQQQNLVKQIMSRLQVPEETVRTTTTAEDVADAEVPAEPAGQAADGVAEPEQV